MHRLVTAYTSCLCITHLSILMVKIKESPKNVNFLTNIHIILVGLLGSNDDENKKHKIIAVIFYKILKIFLA